MFRNVRNWFGANNRIERQLGAIMATQKEMATAIDEQTTLLQKVANESALTLQRVNDLEAQLEQQDNVSEELQASFDRLKEQVTKVDELVPDAEVPNPAEGGTSGETTSG